MSDRPAMPQIDLARLIDHTLLRADAAEAEFRGRSPRQLLIDGYLPHLSGTL